MRVLITSTPGTGHVMPMVPIALALQAAAHTVRWATGPDAQDLVRQAGLEAVPAGTDQPTRMRRFREGWPGFVTLPPRERRAVAFPALFGTLSAAAMYDDLLPVAEGLAPDVIVHDPCELAAAPLARRLGVPHATVGFGRLIPPALLAAAAGEVAALWRAAGVDPPADCGLYDHLYVHPLPTSWEEPPAGAQVVPVRPLPDDHWSPPAAHRPRERPRLYVTFGTEFGPMAPWRAVVDGLGLLDVDALLTVGSAIDPRSLEPLPPGVRAEQWVPQRDAMADADLVVSHGGSGAMIGAAASGLPHLVLPIGADHFENADLVEGLGIGAAIEPDALAAETVAAAVTRLLDDEPTRSRAQARAAELASLPPTATGVALVEALV